MSSDPHSDDLRTRWVVPVGLFFFLAITVFVVVESPAKWLFIGLLALSTVLTLLGYWLEIRK